MAISLYDFPDDPASSGYRVFPEFLESDDHVFFHSTLAENCRLIFRDGFRIPYHDSDAALRSVSFSMSSAVALNHAMDLRSHQFGAYCIIAVRYASLERSSLVINLIDIHDFELKPPPELIGYCTVPDTYKHL